MWRKAKSESGHPVGWSRLRRDELPDRDQQSRRLSMKPTRPNGILRTEERRSWVLVGAAAVLVSVVIASLALLSTRDPQTSSGTAAGTPEPGSSATLAAQSPPASPTTGPTTTPPTAGGAGAGPAGQGPNQPGCSSRPSSCGYPDGTNTGVPAGVALTVINGSVNLTTPGAVLEGKDIHGCVLVQAPNVTIRRSKVTCPDGYGIGSFPEQYSGGGLLVEDVEVTCANGPATAIGYYGLLARRVNLHNCENGFDIDDRVTVVDSYIHDMRPTDTGHTDGIQLAGGSDILIRHNTIFNPDGTSAIISHPSANANVTIEANLLGGGAYTLYCPRDSSTNFRVLNNRFSTLFGPNGGAYGPWDQCQKVAENHGNVWDSTLVPVPPE